MISRFYADQVARVLAVATDHTDECAVNVIRAAEENAALDGIELTDDQAVDQALEMINVLCRCDY